MGEKEMLEMRDKIEKLSDYVKTSDLMLEEMSKMTETLVNIIEENRSNGSKSSELHKLYTEFSGLEESVDQQKDNLRALKMCLNANNGHNVMDLIHSWRRVTETRDQFIQTHDVIVNNMSEFAETQQQFIQTNDLVNNSSESLLKSLLINETISDTIAVKCDDNAIDINLSDDDYQPVDEDMETMDARSDSGSEYTEGVHIKNDDSDSDYEVKPKRKSPKKSKKSKTFQIQSTSKFFDVTDEQMDQLIRPQHKKNDFYLCDESGCIFSTADRFRFYNHLKRHSTSALTSEGMRRLERMDDVLLPMTDLKLKAYVCDWPDCQYSSANKRVFYQHYCRHKDVTLKSILTADQLDNESECQVIADDSKMDALILPEHRLGDQYVCNDIMCGFSTEDKERFYNHLQRHPTLRTNPKNFRHLERRDDAVMPLLDRKTRIFTCNASDCHYKCKSKKDFYRHLNGHKNTEPVVSEELDLIRPEHRVDDQYACDESNCTFRTTDRQRFSNHLQRHQTPGISREKFRRLERTDDLTLPHWDATVGRYVCHRPDCAFRSESKYNFYKHLVKHSNPNLKDEVDVEAAHKSRKLQIMDERIGKCLTDGQYVCHEIGCDFMSVSKLVFHSHWLKHNPPVVPVSALFDLSLERPFVFDWPECGVAYKVRKYLRLHRRKHLGITNFACGWPGCDYRCNSNTYMRVHRRTHTKERPRQCSWPGCEYTCNSNPGMNSHMRKHTGEKPYECPFPECGFRTSQSCALTTHKRRHTGEKPFVCTEIGCDKRFSAAAGLFSHRKSAHNSIPSVAKRGRKQKQWPQPQQ
ncbi:unnamed protein product [Medioppia subpectinata]|uniref:C2H2-type domain-containing protein n=1 Tax=Medioppia subpectinata TaxID=1979941 RepID=A0A7R9KGI2_9ACAR|nr:unnamed protein product [Medioppia subpectinata]CAG2101919.1 unnamed protein product [Medioppia subpectinata]